MDSTVTMPIARPQYKVSLYLVFEVVLMIRYTIKTNKGGEILKLG